MQNKNCEKSLYCGIQDKEYPLLLRGLSKKPEKIYYKGNIDIVNAYKNVAVIGSRNASKEGLRLAYETGQMVAEQGLNVVNGLALGCDTEALRGALSKSGKCIAILPCGIEQVYPKSNQKLAELILENGGCILSEYPPGTPIKKYQYVERDYLQSGISQGVLMIEAQEKSGTMHTVEFAIRQYRRLACYYAGILKGATGNQYVEKLGKAEILKVREDVQLFLEQVGTEDSYEQLSFDWSNI